MVNSKNQISKPYQKEILALAGTWKSSKEEAKKILKIIYKNRKNSKSSMFYL